MSVSSLPEFIAVSLVVLLIPGPGVVYVATRSVSQGLRAGFISAVGLSIGAFVHVIAATAGLSAILTASATAFTMVKWAGAAYLIYLGLSVILKKPTATDKDTPAIASSGACFRDGVIVSVLNPKIAVFFLAFLPQFIDTSHGSTSLQVFGLGLTYCSLSMLTDSCFAYIAHRSSRVVHSRFLSGAVPRFVTGFIYIGLGVNTAITGRR